jgi:hypothetical protein
MNPASINKTGARRGNHTSTTPATAKIWLKAFFFSIFKPSWLSVSVRQHEPHDPQGISLITIKENRVESKPRIIPFSGVE